MKPILGSMVLALPFPTLNDLVNAAKGHWGAWASAKERHTTRVAWACRAARCAPVEVPVDITFVWMGTRRPDPDNQGFGQKFILDGMVLAKVLPKDTQAWIRGLRHLYPGPDGKGLRVLVVWEPTRIQEALEEVLMRCGLPTRCGETSPDARGTAAASASADA